MTIARSTAHVNTIIVLYKFKKSQKKNHANPQKKVSNILQKKNEIAE